MQVRRSSEFGWLLSQVKPFVRLHLGSYRLPSNGRPRRTRSVSNNCRGHNVAHVLLRILSKIFRPKFKTPSKNIPCLGYQAEIKQFHH